ncbi:MAG: putative capsular polysaccharide synthesis family protein [Pirellulaceae bacterium]|nr:putative capsular polysaccharide synthesis family protein [Pirellulaceae bacterium]
MKKIVDRFSVLRKIQKWYWQKLNSWRFKRKLERLGRENKLPVLVYQMAKVGSRSVVQSFPTPKYPFAVHIHRLHAKGIDKKVADLRRMKLNVAGHYWQGKAVYQSVIKRHRPFKMITPVREPIGRNLSFFFERFEYVVGMPFSESTHSVKELTDIFLSNASFLNRLSWFNDEFRVSLGVDIYEHPFPQDLGFKRIRCGNGEVLLLKIELENEVIEKCIADFLDEPGFELAKANTASSKEYAETYRLFCSQVVLPATYINQMLDSRYTKYFYTVEEIARLREKWFQRLM